MKQAASSAACFMLDLCLVYSSILMMEVACYSETSADFQWTTQLYHISQDFFFPNFGHV
jgi:hypothetical protein